MNSPHEKNTRSQAPGVIAQEIQALVGDAHFTPQQPERAPIA